MEPARFIKAAMAAYRGDDLQRAQRSFRGMTTEQMLEQFGASGRTRQDVLEQYQRADSDWVQADALLRAVIPGYSEA